MGEELLTVAWGENGVSHCFTETFVAFSKLNITSRCAPPLKLELLGWMKLPVTLTTTPVTPAP